MSEPRPRNDKIEAIETYFSSFGEILDRCLLPAGWQWKGIVDFVRKNGSLLPNTPLTKEEETFVAVVLAQGITYQEARDCYRNAMNLAAIADMLNTQGYEITYGEGYGCSDLLIPVEHAVMVLNGKPIDATWQVGPRKSRRLSVGKLLERVKHNLDRHAYYMVKLPLKECMVYTFKQGHYGVIDMNRDLMKRGIESLTLHGDTDA